MWLVNRVWSWMKQDQKRPSETKGRAIPDPVAVAVDPSDSDEYTMDEEEDISDWETWSALVPQKPKYKYYRKFHASDSGLEDNDMDGPGWTRRYKEFLEKAGKETGRVVGGVDVLLEDYVKTRMQVLERLESKPSRGKQRTRALRQWKSQFIIIEGPKKDVMIPCGEGGDLKEIKSTLGCNQSNLTSILI